MVVPWRSDPRRPSFGPEETLSPLSYEVVSNLAMPCAPVPCEEASGHTFGGSMFRDLHVLAE